MKKSTLLVFALWAFSLAAQVKVGDNPTTINPAAALEIESTDKGLLPPRMTTAQRDAIANPPTGLIVFNTSVGCLQINQGVPATPDWICIGEAGVTVTIDCNTNGFSGTYTEGEALTTQTLSVTVTNTSFSQADINFNVANVTLSGVSGISVSGVSPASASLSTAGASQLVTYTLSGTPTSFGTLTAAVDIAGILTCNTSVTVSSASDAVLAQIGNEADDPDNVNSVVTVAQLNTITPSLTGVTAGNETAYQEYIDANPNAFSNPATQPEVQAMITSVNANQTLLANIGTDADNGNNALTAGVTAADFNALPGVSGATVANEAAYLAYIAANANAFSAPATTSEVQAMITAVNASQTVLAQIGLEGDNPDVVNSVVTVAQLNTILPALTGVDPAKETAYQDYIDANPDDFSSPATQAEVQAMINALNPNIPGNATCATATISATPCTASELSSGINGGSLGNKYNNGAGGTYSVVEINGQCWMQENIDVNPTSSPAWVNNTDNGWYGYYNNTYQAADEGTLMQWSAAMNGSTTERAQGVCPTGWHVPSDCEWMYLENSLGMTTAEQQVTGYRGSEGQDLSTLVTGGTNSSGFTALLAGARLTNGTFSYRGTFGRWWSSSESSATTAHNRALNSPQAGVARFSNDKALGFSVRCLKD